jgi:hypothetical protein
MIQLLWPIALSHAADSPLGIRYSTLPTSMSASLQGLAGTYMMAAAVVDDVFSLQLEGRQQVSDQGDLPGRTHGGADGHAIKNHFRIGAAVKFGEMRMGQGDESAGDTGRLHSPCQGLDPTYVIGQQANGLLHNEFLKF